MFAVLYALRGSAIFCCVLASVVVHEYVLGGGGGGGGAAIVLVIHVLSSINIKGSSYWLHAFSTLKGHTINFP